MVYTLAEIVKAARRGDFELKVPDEHFPIQNLAEFQNKSIDLRMCNGGNGLSYVQVNDLMRANEDVVRKFFFPGSLEAAYLDWLRVVYSTKSSEIERLGKPEKKFLSMYRSFQQDRACVYGITKDT